MDHAVRDRLKCHLCTVDEQVRRCQTITGDLLGFARMPLAEKEVLDINELVGKTVKLVTSLAKHKPEIEVKSDGRIPSFCGDAHRLQQVLVNLLNNAVNATGAESLITVVTRLEDRCHFHVEVKDTGQGISPETTNRIFDPFFSTQPGGEGIGLGLSTCYYIIKEMKGQIDVESVWGKGSTFTITLPIHRSSETGAASPEGKRATAMRE